MMKNLKIVLTMAAMVASTAALADGPLCTNAQDCNALGSESTLLGGPSGTTMGSDLTSRDRARKMLMNQAAADAADFLAGAKPTEILQSAMAELRAERKEKGDNSYVSDAELANAILEYATQK